MNATETTFSKIIQIEGTLEHYHVPKYQREYTWGKWQWDKLLLDIDENAPGHYMGSIICVDENEEKRPGEERLYEVVDGQQRLITLSLLMMSIYMKLHKKEGEIDKDDQDETDTFLNTIASLRKKLIKKKKDYYKDEIGGFIEDKKMCFLRCQPSMQNHNFDDYNYVLKEVGLLNNGSKPKYCGLRLIYKAFAYFKKEIPDTIEELYTLFDKLNQLIFIHISVSSQANAFTLFETLNNRGVPLSAIDIIKNKLLAEMEKQHQVDVDESYEDWQIILGNLPDTTYQERFLRHYYNCFKINGNIKIDKYPKATKSTLIGIYETLIKKNAHDIFQALIDNSAIYNQFIEPENLNDNGLSNELIDLNRISAAPSYLLLLYLFSLDKNEAFAEDDIALKTIKLLQNYYVRRNITDFPSTRDLDAINTELIEKCHSTLSHGERITFQLIEETLLTGKGKPSSVKDFKEGLEDSLFYYNSGMARYVLAKLDSISHSREYKPDLWARNEKGLFVWTVEHIFPQGENIPQSWIDMIGNGEKKRAEEVHENHVHCLGNLTLSGYNSKLSNSSFQEKQSKHEDKKILGYKINIGYKNGLALNNLEFEYKGENTSLAHIKEWNEDGLLARNNKMVDILLDLYRFDFEKT